MVNFSHLFNSVYLAVVCASVAIASPTTWPDASSSAHPSTSRVHIIGKRGLKLTSFNPASKFETFQEGIEHTFTNSFAPVSLEESTVAFISERLSLDAESVRFRDGYTEDSTSYAYAQLQHAGVTFANSVANVAFKDDKVVAFASSFVKPSVIADSTPTVTLEDAIKIAEELLEGEHTDAEPKLEYIVVEDGSAILTHVFQIRNREEHTWFQAFVDAHSGELRSVVDFNSHATYLALPLEKSDPTQDFELITDRHLDYPTASPTGWHTNFNQTIPYTDGNNAVSYTLWQSRTAPETSPGVYNYPTDLSADFDTTDPNAGIVNAFFATNELHDIWYLYGFTEQSYNFQMSNYGKGGREWDRVIISTRDVRFGGLNNAYFSTPPDGYSGEMMMLIWNYTVPSRDSALATDIVIHEYTHGLTNRLTGGGTALCLTTQEARGLGEGWSDAMADWASQTSAEIENYAIGVWISGRERGLRGHFYSTRPAVNGYMYSHVQNLIAAPHSVGTVWANILHNVHAELLNLYGFDADAKKNPESTAGNAVYLHLFLDSLKLQPCNPTFVHTRDAWIQADANRYGGANRCLLWKVFASRGLGLGAVSGVYVNSLEVPEGC